MFRAVYPKASQFKSIAQTLAKIVDEIPFYAEPDVLEVRVLSPDKTTMTILRIASIAFEEYMCDAEEYFVVSADELNKIARRGTKNDVVVLELDRENGVLNLVFRNTKTGVERLFKLQLRERVAEKIPELNIDLGVKALLSADDYKNIVRDLKIIGEEAVFVYNEGKIIIRAATQQKEYEGIFERDNPLILLDSLVEKAVARYSIGLLEATLKAATASKNVSLAFDNDKPIRIEFEIPGGGVLIYWIAPRTAA